MLNSRFDTLLRRLCHRLSRRARELGTLDDRRRKKFIRGLRSSAETMRLMGCVVCEDLEASLRFSDLLAGVRQLQRRTLERWRDRRRRELGFHATDDQIFTLPGIVDPALNVPGITDEQRDAE